jgi:ubiquinone/menaquinone biosynthesis C-methylase UbiE
MASGMTQTLKKGAALGLNNSRALLYTLESLPLPIMHRLIVGGDRPTPSQEQQTHILEHVRKLLQVDAQEMAEGVYPLQLLLPEQGVRAHLGSLGRVLFDSTRSFWRRRQRRTDVFSENVDQLENFPDYYRRNFHHQTDGYLSDQSASLYEHQVELLFRGLADPMRRRLLKPMKTKLEGLPRPRILEVACGTGVFTRALAASFPNAEITALDLSPYYVRHARSRLMKHTHVDCVTGMAEDLPYKDKSFDAVVSVYLHHELPQKVREQVIRESLRVVNPNGFWGLVDSIQLNDDPQLNWAIESFPENFHEPFYTNYIKQALLPHLKRNYPEGTYQQEVHLLSKAVLPCLSLFCAPSKRWTLKAWVNMSGLSSSTPFRVLKAPTCLAPWTKQARATSPS